MREEAGERGLRRDGAREPGEGAAFQPSHGGVARAVLEQRRGGAGQARRERRARQRFAQPRLEGARHSPPRSTSASKCARTSPREAVQSSSSAARAVSACGSA